MEFTFTEELAINILKNGNIFCIKLLPIKKVFHHTSNSDSVKLPFNKLYNLIAIRWLVEPKDAF